MRPARRCRCSAAFTVIRLRSWSTATGWCATFTRDLPDRRRVGIMTSTPRSSARKSNGSWPNREDVMDHKNWLLMAALLGMNAHAFAEDAVPQKINVVVIDETDRGIEKGVLDRYGLASHASRLNRGPHAEALREI